MATVLASLVVGASAALAEDVDADPLGYCQGSGGALGATTDSEHTVLAGEPPLPAGVRSSRMSVNGVSTRVLQAGPPKARDAVLFVHGSPDSARDWDDLMVAGGHFARTIAFDVPGYGQSDKSERGLKSTEAVALYIQGLLNQLGVTHVVLAAHDYGGIWGLQWAVHHPKIVKGVVMIDTGALIDYDPHPLSKIYATPGAGETQVGTTTRESFRFGLDQGGPLPDAFVNRLYDDYDRATRCALLRYYRSSIPEDADLGRQQAAALRPLKLPALVIWGRNDPYIPVEQAERQREAFPSAQIHIFENSGHWAFIDNAVRTRSLVVPFLKPELIARRPRLARHHRVIRVPVHVRGMLSAHDVQLHLRRVGSHKGATRPSARVTVSTRTRVPRVISRHRLQPGHYVVTVTARGLPTQTLGVRVPANAR